MGVRTLFYQSKFEVPQPIPNNIPGGGWTQPLSNVAVKVALALSIVSATSGSIPPATFHQDNTAPQGWKNQSPTPVWRNPVALGYIAAAYAIYPNASNTVTIDRWQQPLSIPTKPTVRPPEPGQPNYVLKALPVVIPPDMASWHRAFDSPPRVLQQIPGGGVPFVGSRVGATAPPPADTMVISGRPYPFFMTGSALSNNRFTTEIDNSTFVTESVLTAPPVYNPTDGWRPQTNLLPKQLGLAQDTNPSFFLKRVADTSDNPKLDWWWQQLSSPPVLNQQKLYQPLQYQFRPADLVANTITGIGWAQPTSDPWFVRTLFYQSYTSGSGQTTSDNSGGAAVWIQPLSKAVPPLPVAQNTNPNSWPFGVIPFNNTFPNEGFALTQQFNPQPLGLAPQGGTPFIPDAIVVHNTIVGMGWFQPFGQVGQNFVRVSGADPVWVPIQRGADTDNSFNFGAWQQPLGTAAKATPFLLQPGQPFVPDKALVLNTVDSFGWASAWQGPPRILQTLDYGQPFLATQPIVLNSVDIGPWLQPLAGAPKALPGAQDTNPGFWIQRTPDVANTIIGQAWQQPFPKQPNALPVAQNTNLLYSQIKPPPGPFIPPTPPIPCPDTLEALPAFTPPTETIQAPTAPVDTTLAPSTPGTTDAPIVANVILDCHGNPIV